MKNPLCDTFKLGLVFSVLFTLSASQVFDTSPNDATVFLGDTATFSCITGVSHDAPVYWTLNGNKIKDLPKSVQDALSTNNETVGHVNVYTLYVIGNEETNTARIQCVSDSGDSEQEKSESAILLVQGTLSAVRNLKTDSSLSSITMTWLAPESLTVTYGVPDILYSVLISNVTDDETTAVSCTNCTNITETHYTFTADYSSPCHKYTFTVIPFNGAGVGESSQSISGQMTGDTCRGIPMAAIIAPGTVIGALVIVALTVIVFYACRNKIYSKLLTVNMTGSSYNKPEEERLNNGMKVKTYESAQGPVGEHCTTAEELRSDKHTTTEVEESTENGVLASAPTQSSTEGIAEVVGVHRIPRRTAPTSNTERAMLSENMPEEKHETYMCISAPACEHISILIDEDTDDKLLREKDPQGSLATVVGKETFQRVPSLSNIQSYMNKPPLNGAKKDDGVLNDYRSSVPAASSKARDRKASFPQECSETIVHIDSSEQIVCIPSGSSSINQAVQGHEHDDNLDITSVEKGTSAKATVDENDTAASGDLPSPDLSSSEGEAEHSQGPNGTVTTDDLACGHESDASVNETKGQAKSVPASQDADMVTHGTSSDPLNEDCSGCHSKRNNGISAAVSAELHGHTAIETASCEEPCASVNKVSPPSKKSQLTSDVIVPG